MKELTAGAVHLPYPLQLGGESLLDRGSGWCVSMSTTPVVSTSVNLSDAHGHVLHISLLEGLVASAAGIAAILTPGRVLVGETSMMMPRELPAKHWCHLIVFGISVMMKMAQEFPRTILQSSSSDYL